RSLHQTCLSCCHDTSDDTDRSRNPHWTTKWTFRAHSARLEKLGVRSSCSRARQIRGSADIVVWQWIVITVSRDASPGDASTRAFPFPTQRPAHTTCKTTDRYAQRISQCGQKFRSVRGIACVKDNAPIRCEMRGKIVIA